MITGRDATLPIVRILNDAGVSEIKSVKRTPLGHWRVCFTAQGRYIEITASERHIEAVVLKSLLDSEPLTPALRLARRWAAM